MVEIEGVDYSTTPPGSAALRAAGKKFVVRYLAHDSRGITPAELRELTAGGIDVAVVYESTENRASEGRDAGRADAARSQTTLTEAGLPKGMPIYFAVDFDASEDDQAAIDEYLRGAAEVIGANRIGVYGGYFVCKRCRDNGTARWLWQTYAWSGGNVLDGIHLYQYNNFGQNINGTDVDLTRALQENYGQASRVGRDWPEGMDLGLARRWYGRRTTAEGRRKFAEDAE